MGGLRRRGGRAGTGRQWWRGLTRRAAVVVAVMLLLSLAGPQASLVRPGQSALPLSWLWSWIDLPASWSAPPVPPGPVQGSAGTAAGKSHTASSASTKANRGAGRAPGKGNGQLDPYSPHRPDQPGPAKTAKMPDDRSFDQVKSKRVAAAATADSDIFQNADGSFTRRVYSGPHNFKGSDGSWTPIDTSVAKQSDGRWHESANAVGVDYGASADDGSLVSVTVDASHAVALGLQGAAAVTPKVSGSMLTYPSVLPGTDLALTTLPTGVEQSLILRSAAASSWVFPLRLRGLTARLESGGSVSFVDSAGSVRASVPLGTAWDSAGATSAAVGYRLTTVAGSPALVVSVDSGWLRDPTRVFPVTVDPPVSTYSMSSTFADSALSGDNSGSSLLRVGTPDGTEKAISFLQFSTFGATYAGATISAVTLNVFDVFAPSACSPQPFYVSRVGQVWTPSGVTRFPGPTITPPFIGMATPTVSGACANTSMDPNTGTWVPVTMTDVATFQSWAQGGENDGLAITAAEGTTDTDKAGWKVFASANTSHAPYLQVTYSGNLPPVLDSQSPANNATVWTLQPELIAAAHDPDASGTLTYEFGIWDSAATATPLAVSAWQTPNVWQVPANLLAVGKTYLWWVMASDGVRDSATQMYSFRVEAPQPPVTSRLSQNGESNGLDPSTGNYTTTATDATVLTAGPPLEIQRYYNSKDPGFHAFGVGWSSVLDSRVTERTDPQSGLFSAIVTYPDGQQVGFGRLADGSFQAPSGRYATLKAVPGGYTLTDKNQTVYTFGQFNGASDYAITRITDPNGRYLTIAAGGSITSSVSGRSLHLHWGATGVVGVRNGVPFARLAVVSVSTDDAVPGDDTTAQTWTYRYTAANLSTVCPPTSSTACTHYSYQSATAYPDTVSDLAPRSYWRLGEPAGATVAASQVLANNGADAGTYHNVTLGVPGALNGSTATAASFNGSTSWVDLTQGGNASKAVIDNGRYQSVSMWFKTSTAGGVLFSYQKDPETAVSTPGYYMPALYVGSDGKLYGEFWQSSYNPIHSANTVTDNQWHHVVLAGAGNTQSLYLDGVSLGSLAGQIGFAFPGGVQYAYVGAGFIGSEWPNQSHHSTTDATGWPSLFNGSIADVGFFNTALDAASVSAMYNAGNAVGQLMSGTTRPSGNTAAALTYDTVTGRVATLTDANGGTWTMKTPGVSGSSQVYVNSVLGGSPQAYFRLDDTSGPTAKDQVKGGDGIYSNATLGEGSPFADGTPAASFSGSSSYVSLPNNLINGSGSMSLSMWFRTMATVGPLLSYNQDPITAGTSGNGYVPALYVGSGGKLHAEFWAPSGVTPIATSSPVNDNKWHNVVLAYSNAGTGTQALYLDGNQVGLVTGTVAAGGFPYGYVGAGFLGGAWPDEPYPNQPGRASYFAGTISDVAYYRYQITQAMAETQYAASRTANSLITNGGATPVETVNVTDPGNKTISYAYDPAMGNRMLSRTDGLGNTTRYGYDSGGFLNTMTDANGVVTTTGHDVRGNTVSRTTCQNQATNSCSTTYYAYYPDDSTPTPTPDPRNDAVLTMRDGRSADGNDNTYRTTYGYDPKGNLTSVTTPPVPGFPGGRTTTTSFTDGAVPAQDSGFAPAGLPWKVTTAGGAVSTTSYFQNGDIAVTTDAVGLAVSYIYDKLGRPTSKKVVSDTYPSGLSTTTVFDKLNRLTTQTDPGVTDRVTGAVHTRKSSTTYDDDGHVTSQAVADLTGADASRTVSATFNSHGQQVTSTDSGNNTTTFGYDAYGNKNTVVDASGTEDDYTFDADGRTLTTTLKRWTGDPANPSAPADLVGQSWAYDPAGRVASVTDSMGWVTSYTYTDDGLPATVTRSDPAHPGSTFVQESDTYDAAGDPVGQVANNGATTKNATLDAAGRTSSVMVDPTGVKRTTSYVYSPDDAVLSTTSTSGISGSGSTTVLSGYDLMGRPTSKSVINDPTNHPTGWWRLTEAGGTAAADSSGVAQTALLSGGASLSGGALATDGASGSAATAGRVLDTTQSFSVSAWVNPSALTGFPTVVSQDAVHNAGFYLEYSSSLGKWVFNRTPTDTNGAGSLCAASNSAATANTWVHLVGTFNSTNGLMTLYVNGAAQTATATDSSPFASNGPLAIGRAKYSDAVSQYFHGQIADVQVYQRLLSASDASTLFGYGRTGAALSTNRLTSSSVLDQRGLPTSSTDPNGSTTNYTYDEAGQLAVSTAPTVNTETNGDTPTPTRPVSMVGYDTFGARTESEDPNGNVFTTAYDASGRPVSATSPSYTPPGGTAITAVSHRAYNRVGQLTTATDPLGHQTTYVYDQLGRLATVTAPNLGVTHYTYDVDGDRLSVTDANGAASRATYDYLGRTLTATQVVRQPSTNSYTTNYAYATTGGWLSSVTTPGKVATSYGYDNVGETTSVTDAASNVTQNTYDYVGRRTKTKLADNTAVTATFDAAGRQTAGAKLDTDGTTVLASMSAGYDGNGNATSLTDARGHTSTFTFDATNVLTGEVQPISSSASITTSFGYDAAGHRTRFTDGRGNAFITTYNTWGLPKSTIEPSTTAYPNLVDRTFTTAYDANGRVASQTSPGGVSVSNTYDVLGNLTGQSGAGADASTTARSFGYDTGGRLTSVSAPGGTDTFSLDDRGLLLSTAGPSGSSSFAYNGDGLMTSRTDASGTSSYTYDTDDRLKTVTDASTSAVLTLSYNALSQPSGITYGAGADTRSYGYDHLHRLTSDTFKTNAGSTIASITYGYDADNNETSKATVGFSGASSNTYTYDWADRLLSWNNGTATSNYAYDNSGNRTQSGTQTFAYNARNELTAGAGSTYNYTARGTLASVVTGGTTVTTTNDAFGQAITQGNQSYAYDGVGRVVTDTTSGGGTRTLSYSGTTNEVAGDGTSTYSRGPGGGLVGVRTGGAGKLAWTDLHTDVVGQFAAAGSSLAGSTTYGPLGTIVASAGMSGNLGYQSGWTETSNGRVNMAARWYNPATGQFDNRDSAQNSPTPNSANANGYAFVNDNPLTGTDPTGHRRAKDPNEGGTPQSGCTTDNDCNHDPSPAPPSSGGGSGGSGSGGGGHGGSGGGKSAPPPGVTVQSGSTCGGADWRCSVDVQNKIDDAMSRIQQQRSQALAAAAHCTNQKCYDDAMATADWIDNGDGTYTNTDGTHLVTYTDDKRVKQIADDKAAAAKKAECQKSWWCKAKTWAEDHASLVGAIAGGLVGGILGAACTIGSWGVGTAGCIVLGAMVAGAVNGLVTHSLEVASGKAQGGFLGFVGATVEGGYQGIKGLVMTPIDAVKNGAHLVSDIRHGDWKGAAWAGLGLGLDVATMVGVRGAFAADAKAAAAADSDLAAAADGAASDGAAAADGAAADARPPSVDAPPADVAPADAGLADPAPAGAEPPAAAPAGRRGPTCKNSFDPNTRVVMADGTTQPIKDVKVDDRVLATDPVTGTTGAEPVTQLHSNQDTDLTDVAVTNKPVGTFVASLNAAAGAVAVLHTTAHHPFWDDTAHQWIPAGDLVPGHRLIGPDGLAQYVAHVDNYVGSKNMRNLTVADVHTYYVIAGATPVLVHNCGTGGATPTTPGAHDPVPLYRNVDDAEFDSIATTGKFGTGPGNMEGKWFATQGEHADQWGQALNNGEGLTVQTTIPRWLADQLHYHPGKLDGIGPGMYADADQLALINEHMSGISLWPS
jgi:large repetitive protein